MKNINVVAKKMARNGLKIANSLGCAFHFKSDFSELYVIIRSETIAWKETKYPNILKSLSFILFIFRYAYFSLMRWVNHITSISYIENMVPYIPTGQRLSNVGTQQKKNQSSQSYSYIMRKVWYISSTLNSNLFWFHCVRTNIGIKRIQL